METATYTVRRTVPIRGEWDSIKDLYRRAFGGHMTGAQMNAALAGPESSLFSQTLMEDPAFADRMQAQGEVTIDWATFLGGLGSALGKTGAKQTLRGAADAIPNPRPVFKTSGAPDRSSPWYVAYRDADGRLRTMGNLDGVHAEVRIQQLQPGTQMSKPFGWRTRDGSAGPEWVEGKVCASCQAYPRQLFAPGTRGAKGGPWGEN